MHSPALAMELQVLKAAAPCSSVRPITKAAQAIPHTASMADFVLSQQGLSRTQPWMSSMGPLLRVLTDVGDIACSEGVLHVAAALHAHTPDPYIRHSS